VLPDVRVEPGEIVFKESDEKGWCESSLRIMRDMLEVEKFQTLRLVARAHYYALEETLRTNDEVRVAVRLCRPEAPTYPMPLQIRYEKHVSEETIHVPVRRLKNQDGVDVVPSCYFASTDPNAREDDLRRSTARTIRLVSDRNSEIEITGIRATCPSRENPFAWNVSAKMADRFQIWASHIPEGSEVSRVLLAVSYLERWSSKRGEVTLSAYLLSRPSKDSHTEERIAVSDL
jgi:hypothetical protein